MRRSNAAGHGGGFQAGNSQRLERIACAVRNHIGENISRALAKLDFACDPVLFRFAGENAGTHIGMKRSNKTARRTLDRTWGPEFGPAQPSRNGEARTVHGHREHWEHSHYGFRFARPCLNEKACSPGRAAALGNPQLPQLISPRSTVSAHSSIAPPRSSRFAGHRELRELSERKPALRRPLSPRAPRRCGSRGPSPPAGPRRSAPRRRASAPGRS